MMILVHANAYQTVDALPVELLKNHAFIALAGPEGAFDALDLPESAGRVGASVLRVTYLQPQVSAFAVLTDCARLFQRHLAEHLGELLYIHPTDKMSPDMGAAPVTWMTDDHGNVIAFRLAPLVAGSPLLSPLTRELMARPMTDTQRFDLFAAAFAGA